MLKFWILVCHFAFCILIFGFNDAYALNIDKVKQSFLGGDYDTAINEGEKLMAQAKGGLRQLDELYYILGLSYMKAGNYLRASDIFEIIASEFKDGRFKVDAYVSMADIDFLQGNYDLAESKYRQILENNSRTKLASLINFKLAQCALKKGDWPKARKYLDNLNRDFPLSIEARLAKNLSVNDLYFTIQVGSFSNSTNANNLSRKLNSRGYAAYIEEFKSDGSKVYRVRVGKLNSRLEAEDLEKRLIADGFPTRIFP